MKFNYSHIAMLFLLCATIVACNKNDLQREQDSHGKTPIELSVGGVDIAAPETKAVVTDGTTNTDFGGDTKVFILMMSEKEVDEHGQTVEHDGYEYKGDRLSPMYTVSRGDIHYSESHTKLFFDSVNQKYWDDAHARSSQLTMWAVAQRISQPGVDGTWKSITLQKINGEDPMTSETTRDTYNTTVRNEFQSTKSVYPVIYTWNIGNPAQNQTEHTLIYQDLLFSNNIADYTGEEWDSYHKNIPVASRTDKRLKFDFGTRRFPASTQMKFYHAMSKITIVLKAGEGFKADGSDFDLKNNTIDHLSKINTQGLFNIKDGEFQTIHQHEDITVIPGTKTTSPDVYYTLQSLAIPNIHEFLNAHGKFDVNSRFAKNDSELMLQFTVGGNMFRLTGDDLYKSLVNNSDEPVANATKKTNEQGTYIPLEAGKNYVFTFTLNKTKITNITAVVADWETVTADEQTPSNARITLDVEDRSGSSSTSAVTSNMDIYRALDQAPSITDDYVGYNWAKGYNVDGKATWQGNTLAYNTNRWSTDWYWESNKTYYHFRTLSPTSQVVTTDETYGDYTSITSTSCAADSYNAMAWGSPFKNVDPTYKFTYSTRYGFDGKGAEATEPVHQLYQAIGPVKDHENNPIKVLMFHMFSGVHFTVKTSDDADKVILAKAKGTDPETYTRTRVDLVKYYPQGKVRLGTGYIDPDGTLSTVVSPWNVAFASADNDTEYVPQQYYFSAVPQSLENVQLYITTPDDNQYIVDLKDAKATTISTTNIENPYKQNGGKYIIDRWYPGFKYNYSFTLRKSGILDLTATVVAWETVDVGDETVVIK